MFVVANLNAVMVHVQICFHFAISETRFSSSGREDMDVKMLGRGTADLSTLDGKFSLGSDFLMRAIL